MTVQNDIKRCFRNHGWADCADCSDRLARRIMGSPGITVQQAVAAVPKAFLIQNSIQRPRVAAALTAEFATGVGDGT